MRILFDSKDLSYKDPFGTLTEGQSCRFAVRVPSSCGATSVVLVLNGEDGSENSAHPLGFSGSDGGYDRFEASLVLPAPGLWFYYFRITDAGGAYPLFHSGFDQTNIGEGELWQLSCVPRDFSVPPAFSGRVMYQIFPDRFCRLGNPDVSGKLVPFRLRAEPRGLPDYLPDDNGKVTNCDFFGGNLAGIASRLDHLASLGVGVIYLNPIFKAWSNHRYDTADYMKIDELLGTEEDFRRLCDLAHGRGMKVILDGVFSHTGSNSRYFDSEGVFGGGAASDPDSPYRSWFDFQRWPDLYTSWWGIDTLPCVNELDDGFLDLIVRGEDSVVAHWLRAGADGFRLDVADELPDRFISLLRERMKTVKPDALLIGEVWEDASNKISYGVRRRYFVGGELDSVMNYPFRTAVIDLALGKIAPREFCERVLTICENYPPQVLNVLMNPLSTHDTPRILSLLSPEPPPADRRARAGYRMPKSALSTALTRLGCAAFLQFVLPGMPCIYYGDEIAMQGLEDPFNRCFFEWDSVPDNPVLAFYRALGALRGAHEALRLGTLSASADGAVLSLERSCESERLLARVNTGEKAELERRGEELLSRGCEPSGDKLSLDPLGFVLEKLPDRNGNT